MKKTLILAGATALGPLVFPVYAQNTAETAGEVLETIVITGSRVPRADFASNSPLTSIDAERFQVSAETNIVRQLQELPAFSPSRSPTSGGSSGFTGSFADLRGLGRGRTLVLVNGRRWINSISDGGVDLSTIPPELVERVDIVTGGASATYGSDAVAGVVNIILKESFDGLQFNTQSGVTDGGETTNTRIALTAGQEFADGRGSAYFHASYDRTEEIGAKGRGYLDPVVINAGGRFVGLDSPVTGAGTASVDGVPAIFSSTGDLFSAPGVVNTMGPSDLFNEGRYARVQVPADKRTIAAGLNYQLHDGARLYVQGLFVRDEIEVARSPMGVDLSGESIALDNPYLAPSTRAYLASLDTDADGLVQIPELSRRLIELGPRTEFNDRDSYRILAGVEVDLGGNWKLDTSAIYSESNFAIRTSGFASNERISQALDVVSGPDGPQCRQPTFGSLRCVPLNVFGPGTISAQAARFISAEKGLRGNNSDTTLQSVLTGQLFQLPAGAVGMAVGAEHRKSEASEIPNEVWRHGLSNGDVLAEFTAALEQTEGFGEVVVPLLKDAPFAHYLGLELGARYTKFKPGDDAWTYKALGEWSPIRQVKLRGGLQRATRAPNPFELGGADQASVPLETIGADPCFTGAPLTGDLRAACIANGVPAAVADAGATTPPSMEALATFFGNPKLAPEVAQTWTIGGVVSDFGVDGLSFTADYYEIDIEDVITSIGAGIITDQCFFSGTGGTDPLCNEITRDPVTGLIRAFDDGPVNGGGYEVSGFDLSASYSVAGLPGFFGSESRLGVNVSASRLLEFIFTPFAKLPQVSFDCVGFYGQTCQTARPKWKVDTQLSWNQGPVSVALTWSWLDAIADDATRFDLATVPELARVKVSDKHYFDLSAVWNATERLELRAGIENLLDAAPPVIGADRAQISSDSNTIPGLYDALGRRYFVGVRVKL
jgi:iron complex outermembrane recepter protein